MDRFYRGFFAGVIAGIPMNIWSLFSLHVLHLSNLRFLDWTGIMIYGDLPTSLFQQVYSLIIHFFWLGFLGILFAYLVPHTTSCWHLGKAVIFSGTVGFLSYAIPMLYRIPHLTEITSGTAFSNHFGALLWGLTLGYVLQKLDDGASDRQT